MIDIKKKILKENEDTLDRNIKGKDWKIVLYGRFHSILGKSQSFQFTKKRSCWSTPILRILILKTGYINSTVIVSKNEKMDVTKNIEWDSIYVVLGMEKQINNLRIYLPRTW